MKKWGVFCGWEGRPVVSSTGHSVPNRTREKEVLCWIWLSTMPALVHDTASFIERSDTLVWRSIYPFSNAKFPLDRRRLFDVVIVPLKASWWIRRNTNGLLSIQMRRIGLKGNCLSFGEYSAHGQKRIYEMQRLILLPFPLQVKVDNTCFEL